jgi:hypothetical protein
MATLHEEEGRSFISLTDDDDDEGDGPAPSYPGRSSQPRSSLRDRFLRGRRSSSSTTSNADPSDNRLAQNTLSFWGGVALCCADIIGGAGYDAHHHE